MNESDTLVRLHETLAPRLRMFEAVARHQHVTQAADELGVPQPTVSRALARLQDELGFRLVERRGRGVRLTRAGRVLLPHVRRALDGLGDGAAELADAAAGRVTLAFLPTLGAEVVPALIGGFRADRPGVGFTLVQDVWETAVGHLRDGSVDLALTSPLPDEPGLRAQVLHTQPLRLVVPARHPLAGGSEVAMATVADEDFIMLKAGRGVRHLTDDLCLRAGYAPRVAFEGDEIDTVRGLVAAGLGVAVLPSAPGVPAPGTAELAITDPGAERPVGIAWPAGPYEPPAVSAFRTFVLAEGPGLVARGLA
ncbi:DNA-binding transcriptional LysR family regulator [Haloactinopolyspora alba]|uniref:DNA-binding transcriptional LysR family regulator n=1 Tax=Haloactinopolyspora alba TaxID=648780 RepID=A0A2P8DVA1_9ACTN|nr:LysR family transcriptional regulator [Haloactinopolyspora alba]PSL01168.1 DNA-binding transcriptional LysR family regulator [Haloactinopolyspora alba]